MPWKEVDTMSLRLEFVRLAQQEDTNISQLCQRYGISRKTGYKWLKRYQQKRQEGLEDQSRKPHVSPRRTPLEIEKHILGVRDKHPSWGGRKINSLLLREGHANVPCPSTITAILHRNGRMESEESVKHKAFQRFEKEHPNELWQMDFKGHFLMTEGGRCHPLTVLDDCSRFLLGLRACDGENRKNVVEHLTYIFRRYGMPERMLMDNGPPWGDDGDNPYTRLTVWLLRLGIDVSHGRPHHPQTQGKDERLHRTLKAELISRKDFANLSDCQVAFDDWRDTYNQVRPHEALDMCVPGERYKTSSRAFPEVLPPVLYDSDEYVRKVDICGRIHFRNRRFRVGKAFYQQYVALRPSNTDGIFEVFFCHKKISQITFHNCDC